MKKIRLSFLAALLGFAVTAGAQSPPIQDMQEVTPEIAEERAEQEKAASSVPDIKVGKLYFTPIPALAANPAFGFVYGMAASGSIFLGDPTTTKMSNALMTATYTTKNQLMFTLRGNVYTNENKWMLQGDYRFFDSSQPTFGLGTGADGNTLIPGVSPFGDDELYEGEGMEFNFYRAHQTALRQVKPSFYLGGGIHYDRFANIDDNMLDVENGVYTNHYVYSMKHGFDPTGYSLVGASATALYDTRDNMANPYTGRFANISYKYNADFLGSDQSSSTLWMEYRDYFGVNKEVPRNVIAFWTYANVTTHGNLPYMLMPATAWDQMGRSGRGYAQGRWRGDDMFYAELEYRFRLPVLAKNPDLFGGVVFANTTSASARDANVKLFDNWAYAFGAGLRIQIQKATRTNLGIDYAWDHNGNGALYLNLTEYF
ncbi:BamA/TamA family outer membrane protein [Carboxylicivirga mesophila]|uniref:BamA/TamA family outer membrane protein n=1 Tax=Carboxylicivirga mesophila TaxID=1166478 RepID=A0ABS5KCB1_9BACT|nr:BamA/TamA family outer membrane protein [Carboxylicivirga mesophila]MBS2211983.1 BamA/TamA family outer membrane protein [Carboxylicivirga mesophila]